MKQKERATQSPLLDVASSYMKGEELPPVTAEAAARVTCTSIIWETETEADSKEESTPNKKPTSQCSTNNESPTNNPSTKQTPSTPRHATVESDAESISAPTHITIAQVSSSQPAEKTTSSPNLTHTQKLTVSKPTPRQPRLGRNIQRPSQSVRCA